MRSPQVRSASVRSARARYASVRSVSPRSASEVRAVEKRATNVRATEIRAEVRVITCYEVTIRLRRSIDWAPRTTEARAYPERTRPAASSPIHAISSLRARIWVQEKLAAGLKPRWWGRLARYSAGLAGCG